MKVRIGFGLGARTGAGDAATFAALCDGLETLGFDSLWLSERVGAPGPDPLTALAVAAGRTRRLKLGTSVLVLPGRNPVLLAKAMASLDVLSAGRLLPVVGLGAVDTAEQAAFGVERQERGARFDEMLALMRRLWAEDDVTHQGPHYEIERVTIRPRPVQQPLEVWLGGQAPSELRRCGRLGDGWLPSFCDADDVAAGLSLVNEAAEAAGRTIDPGHIGALVAYRHGPLPDPLAQVLTRRRPGRDPLALIPDGHEAVRRRLAELVEAGATKFVVLPLVDAPDWSEELASLADTVLTLQT